MSEAKKLSSMDASFCTWKREMPMHVGSMAIFVCRGLQGTSRDSGD